MASSDARDIRLGHRGTQKTRPQRQQRNSCCPSAPSTNVVSCTPQVGHWRVIDGSSTCPLRQRYAALLSLPACHAFCVHTISAPQSGQGSDRTIVFSICRSCRSQRSGPPLPSSSRVYSASRRAGFGAVRLDSEGGDDSALSHVYDGCDARCSASQSLLIQPSLLAFTPPVTHIPGMITTAVNVMRTPMMSSVC
jgi:hypothetical protein